MKTITFAVLLASTSVALPAWGAVSNKYNVTEAEKAACQEDAQKYCNSADQDEDKLLVCMKANRSYLSPQCLSVFDEGLRKRGLR